MNALLFLRREAATCGRIVTCQYRTFFQNEQKKKRAAELINANNELISSK
jgi:hypothetical protein